MLLLNSYVSTFESFTIDIIALGNIIQDILRKMSLTNVISEVINNYRK